MFVTSLVHEVNSDQSSCNVHSITLLSQMRPWQHSWWFNR